MKSICVLKIFRAILANLLHAFKNILIELRIAANIFRLLALRDPDVKIEKESRKNAKSQDQKEIKEKCVFCQETRGFGNNGSNGAKRRSRFHRTYTLKLIEKSTMPSGFCGKFLAMPEG